MTRKRVAVLLADFIALLLSIVAFLAIITGAFALALGLVGCSTPSLMTRAETHHNVHAVKGESRAEVRHETFVGVGPDWQVGDGSWIGVFVGPAAFYDEDSAEGGVMLNPRGVFNVDGYTFFVDVEAAITDEDYNVFSLGQIEKRW